MTVTTVGIDLVKNVFQVYGMDECDKTTLEKQLKRAQVAEFLATLPPSVVGMEAVAALTIGPASCNPLATRCG